MKKNGLKNGSCLWKPKTGLLRLGSQIRKFSFCDSFLWRTLLSESSLTTFQQSHHAQNSSVVKKLSFIFAAPSSFFQSSFVQLTNHISEEKPIKKADENLQIRDSCLWTFRFAVFTSNVMFLIVTKNRIGMSFEKGLSRTQRKHREESHVQAHHTCMCTSGN